QVVQREAAIPVASVEWPGSDAELEVFLDSDRARGFDLESGALRCTILRRAGSSDRLVITVHHLILDGWSVPIVRQGLWDAYETAGSLESRPAPRPFRDFVAWSRASAGSHAEEFWRRSLEGLEPTPPAWLAPDPGVPQLADFDEAALETS